MIRDYSSARRKAGLSLTANIPILLLVAFVAFAWADDVPVKRSSHPRGFASGGNLPPMTTPKGSATATDSGVAQGITSLPGKTTQSGQHTSSGGVAVTGSTRVGVRVQTGTATAVGEQNTAGNRVGSIGGK